MYLVYPGRRHDPDSALGALAAEARSRTGTLTLVFAIYTLGTLVSLVLIAPASDRVGRRSLLVLSVAPAAASTVLYLAVRRRGALDDGHGPAGWRDRRCDTAG